MPEHSSITDPNIHESKGVATAPAGRVYVADGLGSGNWENPNPHGGMYFVNIATPDVITYPSTYTKVSPTTSDTGHQQEMVNSGTGRLTFTGTTTRHFNVDANLSIDQSVGSNRDIRAAIYKNGVVLAHSENIRTTTSGNKGSVAINSDVVLATNDYLELFIQNDGGSGDVNVYTMYLYVVGVPAGG